MTICHFTLPCYLMEHCERYHKYFLEYFETRTLDQTISVLLKYILGDTKNISLNEIVIIEEFFVRNEHIFSAFLQGVISTLQTEEDLLQDI